MRAVRVQNRIVLFSGKFEVASLTQDEAVKFFEELGNACYPAKIELLREKAGVIRNGSEISRRS